MIVVVQNLQNITLRLIASKTKTEYFAKDFKSGLQKKFFCVSTEYRLWTPGSIQCTRCLFFKREKFSNCWCITIDCISMFYIAWRESCESPLSPREFSQKGLTKETKDKSVLFKNDSPNIEFKSTANVIDLRKVYFREEEYYSELPTKNSDQNIYSFKKRCDQYGMSTNKKTFCILSFAQRCGPAILSRQLAKKRTEMKRISLSGSNASHFCETYLKVNSKVGQTIFEGVIKKNKEKGTTEFFQLLISKLPDLQSSLRQAYKSGDILENKLLNADKDVDE